MDDFKVIPHTTYTYETADGRVFDYPEEAESWQKTLKNIKKVTMLTDRFEPTDCIDEAFYVYIKTQDEVDAFANMQAYHGLIGLIPKIGYYYYNENLECYVSIDDEIKQLTHMRQKLNPLDDTSHSTANEFNKNTLPVNLHDKLYIINKGKVYPVYVTAIKVDNKKNGNRICVAGTLHYSNNYAHDYKATFTFDSLGKTLFQSEEEAKAKI